jgi:hypothetical protein
MVVRNGGIQNKNQSSTDIHQRYVALFNAYTANTIVQSEQMTSLYKTTLSLFFTYTVLHLDIIRVFFPPPTDAQVNYLKNDFKIYIKIGIKTALTCFGAITPSSGITTTFEQCNVHTPTRTH